MDIPEDFPHDPWPAAISGVQPKFAARLIDGRYVVGLTPEERAERYDNCADLTQQLVAYCLRKLQADPPPKLDELLGKVERASSTRGWDVSPIELAWCMRKVREELLTKKEHP